MLFWCTRVVVYWKYRRSMGIQVFFFIFITTERRFPKIARQWEDGQLKVNQVRCFLKNQSLTRSVFTKTFVENPQDNVNRILLS